MAAPKAKSHFFTYGGPIGPTAPANSSTDNCNTSSFELGGSDSTDEKHCAKYKGSIACTHTGVSLQYTAYFQGLMTAPCHALVDTGAQEALIGLSLIHI